MLIGLTGYAGAGKDSAAAVMCAAGWASIAFADALRTEVAAAWAIDPRLLTDRANKEAPTPQFCAGAAANANWLRWAAVNGVSLLEPRSPRWAMQRWGTFRRMERDDYWVRHVTYWLQYQHDHGHRDLVVTDVRFPNEAQALRALGGHIVRVHRPASAPLAVDTHAHESEQHHHLVADAEIHNDGDLQHLVAEVWRVLSDLGHGRLPAARRSASPEAQP